MWVGVLNTRRYISTTETFSSLSLAIKTLNAKDGSNKTKTALKLSVWDLC